MAESHRFPTIEFVWGNQNILETILFHFPYYKWGEHFALPFLHKKLKFKLHDSKSQGLYDCINLVDNSTSDQSEDSRDHFTPYRDYNPISNKGYSYGKSDGAFQNIIYENIIYIISDIATGRTSS
jgi:hypothetical protein